MKDTTITDILRAGREVVANGGDDNHCQMGRYCLACCLGIGKTIADQMNEVDVSDATWDTIASFGSGQAMTWGKTDRVMLDTMKLVNIIDGDEPYTQERALAVLDKLIAETN